VASELTGSQLREALNALGAVLLARDQHYEVVLVGGGSLLLRGLVKRSTRDADVVGEIRSGQLSRVRELPDPLRRAVHEVALTYALADDWLNVGPESLLDLGLPAGFEDRLTREDFRGLVVWVAGRYDLVCLKLYAAADHWPTVSRHLQDLVALQPGQSELLEAATWARSHDPSPGFRSLIVGVLRYLGMEDADRELS